MDVRPGGEFSLTSTNEEGAAMPVRGRYTEVEPPERLVLEEAAEGAWHEGAVSELRVIDLGGNRTEMRFRTTIHTTDEMRDNAEAGLSGAFDRLAAHVARSRPLVTGVDFVSIPTRDLDRAMDFYGNVLGLERSSVWQRPGEPAVGAEFENGTVTIALMVSERLGQEFKPHSVPVAFRVDDVAAARATLESRGVQFKGDIIDSGVCHQAIFEDPDGNVLDLHHRYA
jgi:predicted enzyme related to lactoylglutathione lyase